MHSALAYAFIVVAVAPLIGIWRGHTWAKANGMILRKLSNDQAKQAA
jgi:hypothetical protein